MDYENRYDRPEWSSIALRGNVPVKILASDELDDRWILTNMLNETENIRNVFIENVKNVSVYDLMDSEIILSDKVSFDILYKALA